MNRVYRAPSWGNKTRVGGLLSYSRNRSLEYCEECLGDIYNKKVIEHSKHEFGKKVCFSCQTKLRKELIEEAKQVTWVEERN